MTLELSKIIKKLNSHTNLNNFVLFEQYSAVSTLVMGGQLSLFTKILKI